MFKTQISFYNQREKCEAISEYFLLEQLTAIENEGIDRNRYAKHAFKSKLMEEEVTFYKLRECEFKECEQVFESKVDDICIQYNEKRESGLQGEELKASLKEIVIKLLSFNHIFVDGVYIKAPKCYLGFYKVVTYDKAIPYDGAFIRNFVCYICDSKIARESMIKIKAMLSDKTCGTFFNSFAFGTENQYTTEVFPCFRVYINAFSIKRATDRSEQKTYIFGKYIGNFTFSDSKIKSEINFIKSRLEYFYMLRPKRFAFFSDKRRSYKAEILLMHVPFNLEKITNDREDRMDPSWPFKGGALI